MSSKGGEVMCEEKCFVVEWVFNNIRRRTDRTTEAEARQLADELNDRNRFFQAVVVPVEAAPVRRPLFRSAP